MAELLKGAPVAAALCAGIKVRAEALREKGTVPTLAIVRVGENPDDLAYQRAAEKRCAGVEVAVRAVELPGAAPQEALISCIERLNADAGVHGVLLLRPLPPGINDEAVRARLRPEKDVDGITDRSLAGVFAGTGVGYAPCTAKACLELLKHYGVNPAGRRAVVVGRSLTVGRPVAMLLLAGNATVTLCHTGTKNLAETCQNAELLVVAAGREGLAGKGFFAPGQVVVDVGIHVNGDGDIAGDVDFAEARRVVSAITPVPGGVGTVTTAVLAGHVVAAAQKAAGLGG